MKSLTTGQRLRYVRAALRQARTLCFDAADLGGGLTEATRAQLRDLAISCEDLDISALSLSIQCNRDLDEARKRRHGRKAA